MSLEPPGQLETDQPDTARPAGAPDELGASERDVEQEQADLHGVIGSPLSRALRLGTLVALVILLGVTQGASMLIVVASIIVMIFLHELGHYVMAKRAGMLVTEFFIGFGPRIWSFQRGETEYGIKAIPAGAYVRIIGMSNMEEVDPSLESRTYRQKSFHQRLGVAVAGSTMHFLLALVLLFVQFAFIGGPDGERWQVGNISPGSAAEAAGLRLDDEIVAFDGVELSSFDDFRREIGDVGPGTVELEVVRNGETITVPVELSTRMKLIGTVREDIDVIDNGSELVLGEPIPGGVAATAGITGGTTLLAVNGEPVTDLGDVQRAAVTSDGTVTLETATSSGDTRTHEVDLGRESATTEPGAFVGVGAAQVMEQQPIPTAAVSSVETFGEVAWMSVSGVGKLLWPPNLLSFVGDALSGGGSDKTDVATEAASTPSGNENRPLSIIGVAMLGSDLSSQNVANLVGFLAQLNIFLGILNLFPLLPFDGGHVVIACYEKAQEMRRRTTQRYLSDVSRMLPAAYGVIAVLGIVGALAIFVDLTRGVSF